MGSSLRAGLAALGDTEAQTALVLLVDMPGVTAAAIRRIAALPYPDALVCATYDGRRGHPMLSGASTGRASRRSPPQTWGPARTCWPTSPRCWRSPATTSPTVPTSTRPRTPLGWASRCPGRRSRRLVRSRRAVQSRRPRGRCPPTVRAWVTPGRSRGRRLRRPRPWRHGRPAAARALDRAGSRRPRRFAPAAPSRYSPWRVIVGHARTRVPGRARRHSRPRRIPGRRRAGHRRVPRPAAGPADLPGGRGRRGQDRVRRGPRRGDRGRADPAAVLRGLDAAQALYDWDFPRQVLHLRAARGRRAGVEPTAAGWRPSLYDRRFLLARPLLRALETAPCVLLDRRDRPGRRRVRGVPAGAARRLRGDHPGAGPVARRRRRRPWS